MRRGFRVVSRQVVRDGPGVRLPLNPGLALVSDTVAILALPRRPAPPFVVPAVPVVPQLRPHSGQAAPWMASAAPCRPAGAPFEGRDGVEDVLGAGRLSERASGPISSAVVAPIPR